MVDYVELGFWLVAALAVVLFLHALLGFRKYRLLKAEYERLLHQHAKESGDAGEAAEMLWKKIQEIEEQARMHVQKKQDEITILVDELRGELEKTRQMTSIVDQAEGRMRKLVQRVEKKIEVQVKKSISLGKKVGVVRKLEAVVKRSKGKLSEVSQAHERLKQEFEKHELIPIHAEEKTINTEEIDEEITNLSKAIKNIDGQLKSLRKTIAEVEQQLSQQEKSIEVVKEKVL